MQPTSRSSLPRASKPQILVVTDPWSTLDHARDTSLRLIEAGLALGESRWYWADVHSLRLENGKVALDAWQVREVKPGRKAEAFALEPLRETCSPRDFTRVLYRPDPPVDLAYLQPLQLIALSLRQGRTDTQLVNPAAALFEASEKLEPTLLGSLMPATCVASQLSTLKRFGLQQGQTVLKPLHQAQSKGISLLDWRTPQAVRRSMTQLKAVTEQETRLVLLQEYLPGIAEGEQRLWFLDGKLMAHARKIPQSGQFKIDMDRGGRLAQSPLSRKEKAAIPIIGRALRARGVRLAAVDLIEGRVTDYNITSPGLLVQMEQLLREDLATRVVRALQRR